MIKSRAKRMRYQTAISVVEHFPLQLASSFLDYSSLASHTNELSSHLNVIEKSATSINF